LPQEGNAVHVFQEARVTSSPGNTALEEGSRGGGEVLFAADMGRNDLPVVLDSARNEVE